MVCRSKRYPATRTSSAVQELFQMRSKFHQAPNATGSQVPRPIKLSTPPPHLSSAVIAEIEISAIVTSGIICAIATFTINKRIQKNQAETRIIRGELPTTQYPDKLPAFIEPAEFLDRHKDRIKLANSGIAELFQIGRQERVELP